MILIPIAALAFFFGLSVKNKTHDNVKVEDGLGETPILTEAIKKGDIDMFVEYTGTGLLTILKEKYNPQLSPNDVYNKVKKGYSEKYQIVGMLKDDKKFFPPYYAVPIVREQTLKKFPKLKDAVNELGGKISEKEMAEMNAKVDLDKQDPKDVAREFLKKKGLIK